MNLDIVTHAALNDRRRSAERINTDLQSFYGTGHQYRPTLLELTNERNSREGGRIYSTEDPSAGALLPPGGEAQLRKMARDYRRKARRAGKKADA